MAARAAVARGGEATSCRIAVWMREGADAEHRKRAKAMISSAQHQEKDSDAEDVGVHACVTLSPHSQVRPKAQSSPLPGFDVDEAQERCRRSAGELSVWSNAPTAWLERRRKDAIRKPHSNSRSSIPLFSHQPYPGCRRVCAWP